jgi:dipeptidyl aminopeptidase
LTISLIRFAAFNTLEIRPPGFDESGRTKYPVLFKPYGGPESQTADARFSSFNNGWNAHLASTLGYIVVSVDGRGTGFKGRGFRVPVYRRLGELEAEDQIAAARHYASLPYVDETKIGIFGWSFGGFLAAKVIEANSGAFSLGIAVAPVIDWRFYDSVYTERYMDEFGANRAGYAASAVTNMTGFAHAHFFLAAGTADDNVHLGNTMALLDRLTGAQVRGFRSRLFVDSDHSVSTRSAYRELFEDLTSFLKEHWTAPKQRKED